MRISLSLSFSLLFLCLQSRAQEQKCPISENLKVTPSPEDNMNACKEYKCNSCCDVETAKELALVPLQTVGHYNYSLCGDLSQFCSQYMSYVQCFYQCSPNLYPWLTKTRVLNNMPICGSFCDEWYNACKSDMTCVQGQDWSTGFQRVLAGGTYTFTCKSGTTCRNFSEVYQTSREFCNGMWAGKVVYTQDGDTNCMNPGSSDNNEKVVKKVAGEDAPFTSCDVDYIDTGAIIGIVIGCLAGVAIIIGLVIFFIRQRNADLQGKTEKPKESPKELEELNPKPDPLE